MCCVSIDSSIPSHRSANPRRRLGLDLCSDGPVQVHPISSPRSTPCPVVLHRTTVGVGRPIVLTHGVGSSSATWDGLIEALSSSAAVTTWDLRGHGRSERPSDPACYSRDLALDDLGNVVESAVHPGESAVLVGHSLGGYLSMALAITRPSLVGALVLVASGPGFRDPQARAKWNAGMDKVAASFDLPGFVAGVAAQPDALVMDGLSAVTVPTLVIVGERDTRYHGGCAYLERKLGATVVTIEGAGHLVQETHANRVGAAIGGFLDELV